MSLIQQTLNRVALLNSHRPWRGDNPTQVFAVALHRPAVLLFQLLLQLRVIDRTDKFLRRRKGRIVRCHSNTRHHCRYRRYRRFLRQALGQHIANHALALRHQHVQRVRFDVAIGQILQRQQAYLRPVAVHNGQTVMLRQTRQRGNGTVNIAILIFYRQRFSAL